jgi:preprotein translocase subunit SecF
MATRGFNFGIDFAGGVLMEVRSKEQVVDLAKLRSAFHDLEIGFQTGMAEDLGTELQRFACGQQARRPGVQHRPAVTQAGDTLAIEQVGVNTRHLRRAVGAHTQHAA